MSGDLNLPEGSPDLSTCRPDDEEAESRVCLFFVCLVFAISALSVGSFSSR